VIYQVIWSCNVTSVVASLSSLLSYELLAATLYFADKKRLKTGHPAHLFCLSLSDIRLVASFRLVNRVRRFTPSNRLYWRRSVG